MNNSTPPTLFPGNVVVKPLPYEGYRILDQGETKYGALAVFDKNRTWEAICTALMENLDTSSIDFLRPIPPPSPSDDSNGSAASDRTNKKDTDSFSMVMLHFKDGESWAQAYANKKQDGLFVLLPLMHKYDGRLCVFELDDLPTEPPEMALSNIKNSVPINLEKVHVFLGMTAKPLEKYNGTATVIIEMYGMGSSMKIYGKHRKRHGPYFAYCQHCKELNSHTSYICPRK